jgi:acyl-CoA synthetase (AMP-forming)/AMP-acid ligase II
MVEQAIFGDRRVGQVAVVPVPDQRLGELVSAFVIPKNGTTITEDEIIDLCKKSLPIFAVPVMVIVQNEPLRESMSLM